MQAARTTLLTLALGTLGGGLFTLIGFPAAWLAGSMTAVATAALLGVRVGVPDALRGAIFVLLGVSMGSAVTPQTLERLAALPSSLVMLALCVGITAQANALWLERRHGWDRATSRFSSIPGGLSYVLALAMRSPADAPRVAVSQSLRVVVLVAVMPLLLQAAESGQPTVVRSGDGTLPAMLVMVGLCAAGGWIVHRLKVPVGFLMGSLFTSAVLHGGGFVEARLPGEALIPGFVAMGGVIGARFAGRSLATIKTTLRPALETVTLGLVVSAAFALAAVWLLRLPFGQLWLAYAPGGIEAMTVMAFALGVDPAFVGGHHVARLLALSFVAPLWVRSLLTPPARRGG